MKLSIRIKFFLSHLFAIALVSGSIGTYFYGSATDSLMASLQSRLRNSAALLSDIFPANELEQIQTPEHMALPVYQQLVQRARELVADNPDIAFIYVMRRDNNQVRFVIDSDLTPALPGEVYAEHNPKLLEGFIRPSVDNEIASDKWGAFLSGYAPVGKEGTYLVGLDMRADEVQKKFVQIKLAGLLSLLLSILLAIVFSLLLSRHFTTKIDSLIKRCGVVAERDLDDVAVPIGGDELDILTSTFDAMAGHLKASQESNQEATLQLEKAKGELEVRVRERTRDLEQSNEQLQQEIRERVRVEKILEQTARTDYLTELLNRRAMMRRLEQAEAQWKRSGTPFSLIMLDIDHFKRINDAWGHEAGDCVLRDFARFLQVHVRENDELARWGGEEFMILLPDSRRQEAGELAWRLREKLGKHQFIVGEQSFTVTASFGVQENGEETMHLRQLLSQVDQFMYRAKQMGRDTVASQEEKVSSWTEPVASAPP